MYGIILSDTRTGYEISFTSDFYLPLKLRSLDEISAHMDCNRRKDEAGHALNAPDRSSIGGKVGLEGREVDFVVDALFDDGVAFPTNHGLSGCQCGGGARRR